MAKTARIIFSILLMLTGFCGVVLNVNGWATVTSTLIALAGLHFLFVWTNGFHTAYFEMLNGDFPAAVDSITTLVTSAHDSINIVSGHLSPAFYFHEKTFQSLRSSINRGVQIKIVLGEPDVTLEKLQSCVSEKDEWQEFISWKNEGKLTISRASSRLRQHFIVVDGMHVRLESPHGKPDDLNKPEHRTAQIRFFDERATDLTKRFEELARQASPL